MHFTRNSAILIFERIPKSVESQYRPDAAVIPPACGGEMDMNFLKKSVRDMTYLEKRTIFFRYENSGCMQP